MILALLIPTIHSSVASQLGMLVVGLLAAGAAFACGWWMRGRKVVPEVPSQGTLLCPSPSHGAEDGPTCAELQSGLMRQVAHAVRNPLAGILMSAELLREEDDPDQIRASFRRIQEQGLQIKDIIDQIQQAMAVQACQFRLELQALDLGEEVGEAVRVFQGRAEPKAQTIQVMEPFPTVKVVGDRAFLQAILQELLSNAVKFSPKGSVIRVGGGRDEAGARVWVQDQGPGIKPADRSRMFKPFTRLSSVPTAGEGCLGLGLWTARAMAETLGGLLVEEPLDTRGSRFILCLLEASHTSTRTA